MLNDHERKTLREVEHQLLVEDPEFSRSFATRAQHLHRAPDGVGITIFLMAAVLLGALMLAVGSAGGALAFAAGAGLIWLARRHSNDTPSRSTRQPPTQP